MSFCVSGFLGQISRHCPVIARLDRAIQYPGRCLLDRPVKPGDDTL